MLQIHLVVSADPSIKLIFLCSPGNPTGTLVPLSTISAICEDPAFKGIVIVDEAYIDFSGEGATASRLVEKYKLLETGETEQGLATNAGSDLQVSLDLGFRK